MTCDTCGKDVPVVSRVVVEKGYNRANAQPVFNCPDCFEKKNRDRADHAEATAPSASLAPATRP